MPLNTSGRKTKAQILQERLNKYPKFKALYEQDLKGPYYKRIAKPTQATHDLVKKYWAEYAEEVEAKNEKSYAKEITVGSPIPPIEYARGFCVYLCGAVQGKCADFICQATLHSYITTLLACWPRYTGIPIPEDYKVQLVAFIQSSELLNVVPPCLGIRATEPIDTNCLHLLAEAIYSTSNVFRTNRMRPQMAFAVLFSVASAARPSPVVESGSHDNFDEELKWGDITFHLVPNQHDPPHPRLVVQIYNDLLFITNFGKNDRLVCPVLPLLALAFEDHIFEYQSCIEEFMCPVHPPQRIIEIKPREQVKNQVVLRREVMTDEGYKVSANEALNVSTYRMLLKEISLAAGFKGCLAHACLCSSPNSIPEPPIPYYICGLAQDDVALEEIAREMLMCPDSKPRSIMHFNRYFSRTLALDLPGLAQCREQNEELAMQSAVAISAKNEAQAPTQLVLEEQQVLLKEPEMVELRREKEAALSRIEILKSELATGGNNEEILSAINSQRNIASTAARKHAILLARESEYRLRASRLRHLGKAEGQDLNGKSGSVVPSMLAQRIKEDSVLTASFMELHQNLDDDAEDYCILVNTIITSPEQDCDCESYPNKQPTDDYECPVKSSAY
ncbi:hypothetical protein F5880DRAFT_730460 [Lentinula raphanica]|nr:hypothetical protein F5880DRAFT_730460 [Lentinula raphanica]